MKPPPDFGAAARTDFVRGLVTSGEKLGIEPGEMAFGEGLSPVVEETVAQAAATFTDYWRKLNTACSAMASGEASVVNT